MDRDDVGLVFPSDVKIDRNNNLWVFSDRMPVFLLSYLDYQDVNFRIYTVPVNQAITGTVCEPRNVSYSFRIPFETWWLVLINYVTGSPFLDRKSQSSPTHDRRIKFFFFFCFSLKFVTLNRPKIIKSISHPYLKFHYLYSAECENVKTGWKLLSHLCYTYIWRSFFPMRQQPYCQGDEKEKISVEIQKENHKSYF